MKQGPRAQVSVAIYLVPNVENPKYNDIYIIGYSITDSCKQIVQQTTNLSEKPCARILMLVNI